MKPKLKEDYKMSLLRPFEESDELDLALSDKVWKVTHGFTIFVVFGFASSVLLLFFGQVTEDAVLIFLGSILIVKIISVFNCLNRKFINMAMNDLLMCAIVLLVILTF